MFVSRWILGGNVYFKVDTRWQRLCQGGSFVFGKKSACNHNFHDVHNQSLALSLQR